MRRLILVAAVLCLGLSLAAAPARAAGIVDDLLAALGLAPASTPAPNGPVTDAQNCDTGECE